MKVRQANAEVKGYQPLIVLIYSVVSRNAHAHMPPNTNLNTVMHADGYTGYKQHVLDEYVLYITINGC